MEFDKIAHVSGPLSQWVRLSYFSSMLQKYIIKVSKWLQTSLVVFCLTSRIQYNRRHWKRLSVAPGIGLQSLLPQWLPCIKMDSSFIISSSFCKFQNSLMLLRTSSLYRFWVGILLPTCSQDLASNRAPDPPKVGKILPKSSWKSQKNI